MAHRKDRKKVDEDPANRDPLTGEPGSHPAGVGVGTAGGAAAGAAIGAAAGPVGAAIGAVAGGIAGAAAGHGVAERVNPTVEEDYWRTNHAQRPYVERGFSYDDDYAPAYRYGWESYPQFAGRRFDEVEPDLRRDWQRARGGSRLDWDRARPATRDAWDRLDRGRGSR